ncbi:carboxypeptidase-like regulatory domain-containing protein [Brevundimonas sp.]|uniref:carboxypeptidase-like regulatory domain-containing protein n=1 Tax=Brevundimonas sp. TaxID=1871086 RepID=UPI001D210BA2|nr:carboxypeptidase-like regulatory domain-containing protein [Brevundimonas sp.]MBA4001547.1 hypothetical protein [Brevundimonas sp.]
MGNSAVKGLAALVACLGLTACITQSDGVLAPDTRGVVIHAGTGQPVEGAQVRHARPDDGPTVVTGADGGFTLEGRTRRRLILTHPLGGGVFRDARQVRVSAPGLADGYATAGFVNSWSGPGPTLYVVPVLMFPADADETPLHALMRDCIQRPDQHHAVHVAAYMGRLDRHSPPDWMDADAVEGLIEHLDRVLPFSGFDACAQGEAARALFSAQMAPLRAMETQRTIVMPRPE